MFLKSKDFTAGEQVLNMYFSSISPARRPWLSFSECLDYFTVDKEDKAKYPNDESRWRKIGFLENLGYIKNDVFAKEPLKLSRAIKNLANATTSTKIPTEKSFTAAFMDSATTYTFDDLKKDTSSGLKDFGKAAVSVAAVGVGTYLAWITIVAIVLYFINRKAGK